MFSKDNLHHAYFIEGERAAVVTDVEVFLREAFGIERQANPDFYFGEHESFGIEESRMIQEMQAMKAMSGERKIFIIAVGGMTSEAQNALLKVFEEPTPGTHFFLVATTRRVLLPTLASRLQFVVHASSKETVRADDAKAFIKMSPKERLAFVAGLIEAKDKAVAESFLLSLVSELPRRTHVAAIKEILDCIRYLKDRSSSLKLILERIALLDL